MKPHLEEKHRKLREEYKALFAKGLRSEVIIEQLAKKYFYSLSTTNAIIWETAHYHRPKRQKTNLEEKYQKIREEFKELTAKGFLSNEIIEQLAEKHSYSKNTTAAIIRETAHYHKPKAKKSKEDKS